MNNFKSILDNWTPEAIQRKLGGISTLHVEKALSKTNRNLDDFLALISPAAAPYLEIMAQKSRELTLQRFGNNMQLFAPMYLSNECQNICTYCGFSLDNKVRRKTLTDAEILKEVAALKEMGFDHILLVTGEANKTVGVDYLEHAIKLIKPYFANVSIEVQPLDQEEYERLIRCGLHSVLVYQETYYRDTYKTHHPKGKKSNFDYRLETPDRLGRAEIHKVGIGCLIGLEDWRIDSYYTAMHLQYLKQKYWKTKYSISFPRLRPFSGGQEPKVVMNDRELVQLICAYRLFDPDVELSLSTRETQHFRNHAIKLGITSVSAGSKTNPGGYAVEKQSLEQFEISDERGPNEISKLLVDNGYQPVWKDWDPALQYAE
ncbi:2-iminoacetate synthase ThiH [Echinicola sp. CAU 1574]|uniref:2-iminoacetate synthase ThiH n=1 Tax=Echinicola arenosa TaxID=2774144 RepID=A0ABR9ANP8_9BACT|nr:2-iminoacetate synthase ThiH [Echinicola arenosa]MBD8489244.1 2-iminoacetate synthase ThiH [Echinicola arenosa]